MLAGNRKSARMTLVLAFAVTALILCQRRSYVEQKTSTPYARTTTSPESQHTRAENRSSDLLNRGSFETIRLVAARVRGNFPQLG